MVVEEKAFTPQVDLSMKRSVEQHQPAVEGLGGDRYGVALAAPLMIAALAAGRLPPWGVAPVARDAMLRQFITQEAIASSAVASVVSKYASFTWKIDGPPRTSKRAHDMAHEAQDGEGWQVYISLLAMDLLTQDRGAFTEIIRSRRSPDAAVLGFKCLDAANCWLTDDPRNPVMYMDRVSGKSTLMPWFTVYHHRQMPMHHPLFKGLQLSSLTRFFAAAQIWKNISTMYEEKTGGRFSRAIHIVGGVQKTWLEDAMKQQAAEDTGIGLTRYAQPVLMTTLSEEAKASVATIDLASLPEGFDQSEHFREYITVLAMALETDVQELAPLPSGNMGSAMQSQTLDQKSKAKGAANFRKQITHMMNHAILPDTCTWAYDEQDIDEEQKTAIASKTRAEMRGLMRQTGEVDAAGARQLALDSEDISPELFALMNQRDLTYGPARDDDRVAAIPDDSQSEDAMMLGLETPGVPPSLTPNVVGVGQTGTDPMQAQNPFRAPLPKRPPAPALGGKAIPDERRKAENEVTAALLSAMAESFAGFRKAIESGD